MQIVVGITNWPLQIKCNFLLTKQSCEWPSHYLIQKYSLCTCTYLSKVLKNGPSPASFKFIFVFSSKHYNFYNKYK